MSRRWWLALLPVLALVCCVTGLAVGALAFSPLRERVLALLGLRPQILAAEMVPDDAILYASLSYNLQAQPGYETIRRAYLENPEVQRVLEEWKDQLRKEAEIDFDAEIAPWIGPEIGLALFPTSPEALEEGRLPLALLIASRDHKKADAFLQRLRRLAEKEGRRVEDRAHRGRSYQLWLSEGPQNPPLAMGRLGEFVVFTVTEEAFQRVADRAAGEGQPIATSPRFRKVIQALPAQSVMMVYLDYPALQKLSQEALPRLQPGAPDPESLLGPWASMAQALQGAGVAVELQAQGLRLQSIMVIDRAKVPQDLRASLDAPPISEALMGRIPENAFGFLQSARIGQSLRQSLEILRRNPEARRQLQDMEASLGLRLEEDLLAWMTGDLILAALPAPAGVPSEIPVGVSLWIGTDQPEAARAGLARLEDALALMGVQVEESMHGRQAVRIVTAPTGERILAYTVDPEAVQMVFPADAFEGYYKPARAITGNPRFREIREQLPRQISSLFFLDTLALWDQIERWIPGAERATFREKARPFLDPIQGIGIAGEATQGAEIQRGVLFIRIAPPGS
ncbi:DUF3352 domain-containing protein [Thermoflexus hugenholtzii]